MVNMWIRLCGLLMALSVPPAWAAPPAADSARPYFVSVAFHDVVDSLQGADVDAVSTDRLVAFFDYLGSEGWTPLRLEDLAQIRRGQRSMPQKAILITFDDGYRSLYTKVFPLLMAYRIPVVASVVGSWLEPPPGTQIRYGERLVSREHFIDWAQARRMQASGWVEFASHTYDQHQQRLSNPQGNLTPALSSALYDPAGQRYEALATYRERVRQDLQRNAALMHKELGRLPRAITWPYGQYNRVALEVAIEQGYEFALTLNNEPGDLRMPMEIGRYWPRSNQQLAELINDLRFIDAPPASRRLRRIDPADVWSSDPAAFDQRLGTLIEELRAARTTDVVLEALRLDAATGRWSSWFPNRVLPLQGDALHRIAWQLQIRAGVRTLADLRMERLVPDMAESDILALHADLGWQVPVLGLFLAGPTSAAHGASPASGPSEDAAFTSAGLAQQRRRWGAEGLSPPDKLALQAFRAVEAFRHPLDLVTLARPGQTHGLAPWADLALQGLPASVPQARAFARDLQASGALGNRWRQRRIGVWLMGSDVRDTLLRQSVQRALQVEGVGAIGWSATDFEGAR